MKSLERGTFNLTKMKKTLDCPFPHIGKEPSKSAILTTEEVEIQYKKATKKVTAYFYKCCICKKEFTTTESDEKTISQVYHNLK